MQCWHDLDVAPHVTRRLSGCTLNRIWRMALVWSNVTDRMDLDESPMAYRRLPEVLAEHAGTVRVLHTLRPFAVVMAGAGEFDPFRD